MAIQEIKPGVYSIGARHWDRRLFDELIPLPDGTSYNSYLIHGTEKTAVIDSVDPSKTAEWLDNLIQLEEQGIPSIDYIIANHAEQDHSGSIPDFLDLYPNAKVVTNAKCQEFLQDLLWIPPERFHVVQDGDVLSLGDRNLEFIFTPWVHWPETMCTYLKEDNILFSCDFFGSHLADSNLFVTDESHVIASAKRYYAEIMMPFRTAIKNNMRKINGLNIACIAPSHGPIYNKPNMILDAYNDWISDRVDNSVVLAYVSMHGSTERMAEFLGDALIRRGIEVHVFNLTKTDPGQLAMALVNAASLIIGTPTVLTGPHPAAIYAASLVNALRPKLKYAALFGSYGWGGKTSDMIKTNLSNLKVEFLDTIIVKGMPVEKDLLQLDQLADQIQSRHHSL
ncbi:MAG: FprA family A-type flavoprotein [Candidatus Omnitrophota bacterium]